MSQDKLHELLNYFLYRMSRIMGGCIEDKMWVKLEGLRNCGKGLLSDLLKKNKITILQFFLTAQHA